ncbi:hypothetical protein FKW77_000461 [Venturia effusa]|uniref:Uncharacterized protein n=1 Tax=Venturia effusa TaxID=50376 RepID=A0A517KYV9_9PEZI|nr:hypothetical protein FKW77_000461 [Venturia effusa]
MAGGVRNLRAMFEQKPTPEAPSPSASSRGRSPAAADLDDGAGSRTGSKVRASFFPVEANRPRNQTPDTNASTPRRRESSPTSTNRHVGNRDILDIQEQARKELDAVKAEQDIETETQNGSSPSPTDQTQHVEPASQPVWGNNATLHGILSESSGEVKAEPTGFKPELQRELSQKLERKASERKLPKSAEHDSDPFVTKPALGTPAPEDKYNGGGGELAQDTATPAPVNANESDIAKAEIPVMPPMSDPIFLSPSAGQIMENLTIAAKPEDPTPTRPGKTSANGVAQMPRTPTHAPAPKNAASRTGPKLADRGALRSSRSEAPEPSPVQASSMAPASHPSAATNGNNTPASPGANDSLASKPRGTSQGGRTSVSSRLSGTVTTGGFVKPRPKSPTRPVKLPAHLVAPTASSAAKHGNPSALPEKTLARRSSTISNANNFARSAQGGMARRPSTRPPTTQQNRRPAVPPANNPPVPRVPDDSFLARMMRPTASSASKVRDDAAVKAKQPVRPATKISSRPKTNGIASAAVRKPQVEKESSAESSAEPGAVQIASSSFNTDPKAEPPVESVFDSGIEKVGEPIVEKVVADSGANWLPEY